MPLLFPLLTCVVLGLGIVTILSVMFIPKTSVTEINNLLSLDEENLMDGELVVEPKRPGRLDFQTDGDRIRYHYTRVYESGVQTQILSIIDFRTKARLCVSFEGGVLAYFEFKRSLINPPDIYFGSRYLRRLDRSQRMAADHAMAVAQRILAKKFPEAQHV